MWSPSSTELWLTCPLKWSLHRQGVPEAPGRWHPAQLVGTSLHAGWGRYLDPTQPEKSLQEANAALVESLQSGWPDAEDTGQWDVAAVSLMAAKCLKKVIDVYLPQLLDDFGTVLATECVLGAGDKASRQYPGTSDLITEHGPTDARYLVVTDYKTHWTVDGERASRYLSQTERSWQLTQYAWFAQQKFTVPVRYIRSVHVAVTPWPKAWIYTCPVTQKRLDTWYQYACRLWDSMHAMQGGGIRPWPNWDSCEKYGAAYRCGYYDRPECHGGTT